MADLSKLSDEELEAKNQKLMAQREEIRAEQREIADELNSRADERAAEAALAGLTPGARDVVIKAVAAQAKTKPGSSG